ncbi:hypothetical protein [Deinococcus peraridilitoris]|uniref:Uncharacterized protein n=1 Tax=Deinococcus peraridilitoris (strain DSM 19664 / LMG 22246 / CIP 109416 / KR-200) TaxID=937777 RepID=K9ZZL8_DEIPD|nr:hypothetical protein [Deinococcus peraridilitoris]AFZ66619.1 hypothetical protein Deipe_1056 [Deinococcus peraridilitoris DSM 19664]
MKSRFSEDFPASGRGYEHVCPHCGDLLQLHEMRDGDQAYWCQRCERGHRAGDLPVQALRPLQTAI